MAIRVELPKELTQRALEQAAASSKRAANSTKNPVIKQALEQELAAYTTAANTLTETK